MIVPSSTPAYCESSVGSGVAVTSSVNVLPDVIASVPVSATAPVRVAVGVAVPVTTSVTTAPAAAPPGIVTVAGFVTVKALLPVTTAVDVIVLVPVTVPVRAAPAPACCGAESDCDWRASPVLDEVAELSADASAVTTLGWRPERVVAGVAEVSETGAVGGWSAAHAGVAARKTAPAKVKAIKVRIIRLFSRRRTAAGGIKRETGVYHLAIIHQPQ